VNHIRADLGIPSDSIKDDRALATKFRREIGLFDESFCAGSDLVEKVAEVLGKIQAWQTPQEDIRPDHLPPYLREFGEPTG